MGCSEPRLAFSKQVVLRYRLDLESRNLSASTVNLRLAAVRRLAFEAADSGLLSPELAAGIQRVKGTKKVGVRRGNWLTVEQCRALLQAPDASSLKGRRDKAVLAILIGCGLRRAEVAKLQLRDFQQRDSHWAVVDLIGKGDTFAPFRCPTGSRRRWTNGRGRLRLRTVGCSSPSTQLGPLGAAASRRR
jgi:site-specific recombinase XerD